MVSNRIKFIANLGESYFPGLAVRVKNNKHKTDTFRAPQAWIMWLVVSSRFHAFYPQVLSPIGADCLELSEYPGPEAKSKAVCAFVGTATCDEGDPSLYRITNTTKKPVHFNVN